MYRILLADDEQIERMVLAKRLKRHFRGSLDISEAVNGAEALETLKREKSQAVVMDVSMPEMNGVEVAERIRNPDEDCIIIFLTAYNEFSHVKRATVIRALGCLLELYERDELVIVAEEAMRPTDKRLNVSGVPSSDVPSPGVPSSGIPSPGVPSPDTRQEEHAEAMSRGDRNGRLAQVAETTREYIRNNYTEEVSMQDAARMINYSDAYFYKLFRQCLDQNFTSYLTGFRANETKKLLKDRGISVKGVSIQAGYYNSSHLAKVSKRMTGMIPSEYRDNETAQKQNKLFAHSYEGNQGKMGKDKISFLYGKLLRYKIKAPDYTIKKVLRRRQKVLTFSG